MIVVNSLQFSIRLEQTLPVSHRVDVGSGYADDDRQTGYWASVVYAVDYAGVTAHRGLFGGLIFHALYRFYRGRALQHPGW